MASRFGEVNQLKNNPNNSVSANGCESGSGNCTFAGQWNCIRERRPLCDGREMRVGELTRCVRISVVRASARGKLIGMNRSRRTHAAAASAAIAETLYLHPPPTAI